MEIDILQCIKGLIARVDCLEQIIEKKSATIDILQGKIESSNILTESLIARIQQLESSTTQHSPNKSLYKSSLSLSRIERQLQNKSVNNFASIGNKKYTEVFPITKSHSKTQQSFSTVSSQPVSLRYQIKGVQSKPISNNKQNKKQNNINNQRTKRSSTSNNTSQKVAPIIQESLKVEDFLHQLDQKPQEVENLHQLDQKPQEVENFYQLNQKPQEVENLHQLDQKPQEVQNQLKVQHEFEALNKSQTEHEEQQNDQNQIISQF